MECWLRQRSICAPLYISRDVCRVLTRSRSLPSCCRLQRDFWRCPTICRRWVEARGIGRARLHGLLHRVVDVEDDAFRAVFAMRLFVFAFDDGEGLQNVVRVVAPNAVEVEVGRVEFAAQQEAALFVPAEGRARVAAVGGEGLQVPGSIGEFEDSR